MPPARSRPHRAIAFFLGFFAVVLYARTLMGGFVYDDLYYVRDNPAIRHLSNIPYFFTDPDTGVNHPDQARMIYRPLATAFFAVENALFETRRPTLFHATSVVLFLSVFGLLYSLVTLLADRDETPAVFAATLVVVHPIAVESVAWISAQPTVLCAALMLAGLGAYLFGGTLPPERRGAFFFAAGGFFVAAMLVKEVALTAPLIVLAAHRYLKPAYEPRERVWFFAMLTMASLAVFSLRAGLTGRVAQIALYDESPWRHAVLAFGLIPRYLTGLFYPPSLRVFHDAPVWSIPSALVGVAFLGGLVAAAEALRARKPVAAFGLVFCLLTYLPSSNLLPTGMPAADRFFFLPLIGLAIAGADFARPLFEVERVAYALPVMVGIACVLALLTFERTKIWGSPVRFWENAVNEQPEHAFAYYNLALVHAERAELEDAERFYEKALAVDPNHRNAANNLGSLLARQSRFDEAEPYLRRALELEPRDVRTAANLVNVLIQQGRQDAVVEMIRALIATFPTPALTRMTKALIEAPSLDETHDAMLTALLADR